MTHTENNRTNRVETYHVPADARVDILSRHFGSKMLMVEHTVFHFMRKFVSEYDGGLWEFYELSNGGFYMAPTSMPVEFRVQSNEFEGIVSADAAGVIVCLFAFSHLSLQRPADDLFGRNFHALREFALNHAEATLILAAID
jgi:hypothetical protein